MKHRAILHLYPNTGEINEENNIFEVKDQNGNKISIDISAVEAKATELQAEADTQAQAKEDAKVSGNQKLLDLGLTQAEATALTGYTPPVAE